MSTTTNPRPLTISVRLSRENAAQLESLKQVTGESTSELVKRGLSRLYEESRSRRSAYDLLMETGFLGSGSGPEDLSERYKEYLEEDLAAKYGDR